jgi:DedD protein
MERRLKERLIGATLLLGLIIAVVPELLSGPSPSRLPLPSAASPPQPLRNVTVDLATAKTTTLDEGSLAAPAGAASSAEVASAAPPEAAAAPAPPTIATLKAQEPASPPLENAAPSPKLKEEGGEVTAVSGAVPEASRHRWAVQLGSFANRANAEKLVHRLKAHAREAYLSPIGKGPALRYRVRIGPFAERGAAEEAMTRLRKDGETASLVPP